MIVTRQGSVNGNIVKRQKHMDDEKFQLRFQHKNIVTNICKYKFNIVKIS